MMLTRRNCALPVCALGMVMLCARVHAAGNEGKPAETKALEAPETIYLVNATWPNDLNDVQTALRNNFPEARIYGMQGKNAITIRGTAEDIQGAKKMIAELDRPKKVYRVTYTINESDNGKRSETQHYTLLVASGAKTLLKQGNRVPLVTGMGEGASPAQSSQVQYMDVGLSIEASIEGVGLRTKVEQSGVTDQKSGIGAQDPVVRQTVLEGTLNVDLHKPVVLGSIDVPGSTRHEEIEVAVELVP